MLAPPPSVLIITQTRGVDSCRCAQTRSHVGKLRLKGTGHDSGHACLCLSLSVSPTVCLSLSFSISGQTSDGSVTEINNPVGLVFNLN